MQSGLCYRCHDEDNSPKFDFQIYWGQIAHSKLDQYNDPKVHEGIKPAPAAAAAAASPVCEVKSTSSSDVR